jgi:hypothetical protein
MSSLDEKETRKSDRKKTGRNKTLVATIHGTLQRRKKSKSIARSESCTDLPELDQEKNEENFHMQTPRPDSGYDDNLIGLATASRGNMNQNRKTSVVSECGDEQEVRNQLFDDKLF